YRGRGTLPAGGPGRPGREGAELLLAAGNEPAAPTGTAGAAQSSVSSLGAGRGAGAIFPGAARAAGAVEIHGDQAIPCFAAVRRGLVRGHHRALVGVGRRYGGGLAALVAGVLGAVAAPQGGSDGVLPGDHAVAVPPRRRSHRVSRLAGGRLVGREQMNET